MVGMLFREFPWNCIRYLDVNVEMHRIVNSARESSFYAKNHCRHALHNLHVNSKAYYNILAIDGNSAMQTLIYLSGFDKYHGRDQINIVLRM